MKPGFVAWGNPPHLWHTSLKTEKLYLITRVEGPVRKIESGIECWPEKDLSGQPKKTTRTSAQLENPTLHITKYILN